MATSIVLSHEERCIGCGLCAYWASLEEDHSNLSLADSPLRVERSLNSQESVLCHVQIDDAWREKLAAANLVKICPQACFEVREEENNVGN